MTEPVRVVVFAQLRERLGQSELAVALPAGSTGEDLRGVLGRRVPALIGLLAVSRLAVGQEYVSWDHPLRPRDEIAVIPPVSGG